MKEIIKKVFADSIETKEITLNDNLELIIDAVNLIVDAFRSGNKLLIFGNGGSAADSQHIAAEFIGRFQKERRSLPAIALTTDSSILTCLGNDYSFDIIFKRQIEALGNIGDVAFGISTSGNSNNVIMGLEEARAKGLKTISLTGKDGGAIAKLTDISIIVKSSVTARVQESHLTIAHTICQLVEEKFSNA